MDASERKTGGELHWGSQESNCSTCSTSRATATPCMQEPGHIELHMLLKSFQMNSEFRWKPMKASNEQRWCTSSFILVSSLATERLRAKSCMWKVSYNSHGGRKFCTKVCTKSSKLLDNSRGLIASVFLRWKKPDWMSFERWGSNFRCCQIIPSFFTDLILLIRQETLLTLMGLTEKYSCVLSAKQWKCLSRCYTDGPEVTYIMKIELVQGLSPGGFHI